MGLDVDDAAWSVQRIVNANMANAVRKVLSSTAPTPAPLRSSPTAAAGPVHAWAQARELGIDRVLVPKASPAFSALGLLVSDYVVDLMRAYVAKLSDVDFARVRQLADELRRKADAELAPARLGPRGTVEANLFAQMCYHGQNFDMSVPLPEGESLNEAHLLDLAERFHRLHESSRGFAFPNQQPLVAASAWSSGARPRSRRCWPSWAPRPTPSEAADRTRPAHFGDGFIESPT